MSTKYNTISNLLFKKNRQKFTKQMQPLSIAIFNSNDVYPVSADSTLPFQQHRDIFYLSGVDQEESILVLFPDATDEKHKEILFLTETNPHIAVWEGEKLNKEQALTTSGIGSVYWLDEFDKVMYPLMAKANKLYLNRNEHYRANLEVQTREDRFIERFTKQYPLHQVLRSNPILQKIRSVKEPEELALMQTACNITEIGFRAVLGMIKPNVWEFEIEAEYIYQFIKNRSKGFAYTPIVASGNNANVLHYTKNNQACKDGDLILMDVGAEYANYSADMTRTVPVNGKFTARQKQVYNAVNHVKKEAAKMLTVGNNWHDYHKEVGKIMTEQLINLNLLNKADVQNQNPQWPAYKKYFMHGTSHHIGLDTHDYGLLEDDFVQNMVFTVEPGIYIPEEGFGIRLEDDYVIQPQGEPFNLMKNIPIEADEIEELMNQ